MENTLKQHLLANKADDFEKYFAITYTEDINNDALSDKWLDNETSWIYKVGVLTAIDKNKCDEVFIVIDTQRNEQYQPDIIGELRFRRGENDDIMRVIKRAVKLLTQVHSVFED